MATYQRRTVYDMNVCFFEGRVVEEPVLKPLRRTDGTVTDMLRMMLVINSNPYSTKTKAYINLHAFGKQAERFKAKIHKGYGVWCKCELKEIVEKKKEMGTKKVTLTRWASFAVERLHIISIPDKLGHEVNMDISDEEEGIEESVFSNEPHSMEM
jgi:hypothetical protein